MAVAEKNVISSDPGLNSATSHIDSSERYSLSQIYGIELRWKREPRLIYGESRGRSRTMIEENTSVGVPLGKPLEEAAVQAFAAEFRGALVRPGDEAYDAERAVFNAIIDRHRP